MTLDELRAACVESRTRYLDPLARPHIVLVVQRKTEPKGRRVRVWPGVLGELLSWEPGPGAVVRVWTDDVERYLARMGAT